MDERISSVHHNQPQDRRSVDELKLYSVTFTRSSPKTTQMTQERLEEFHLPINCCIKERLIMHPLTPRLLQSTPITQQFCLHILSPNAANSFID